MAVVTYQTNIELGKHGVSAPYGIAIQLPPDYPFAFTEADNLTRPGVTGARHRGVIASHVAYARDGHAWVLGYLGGPTCGEPD